MAEELGRIERPAAAQFRGKRTLLLVPLVFGPRPEDAPEAGAILERYWTQARSQVRSLEARLGEVRHIFHESVAEGGSPGLKFLESLRAGSYTLVQSKCQAGATLEATEDEELLAETLGLQRCLLLPYASDRVARRLQEWLGESTRGRYEHTSRRIDETLKESETGLLFISERHQVQFPADVEVFYVAPPALDEFRRWAQEWAARQAQAPAGGPETGEGETAATE